jgi:hypothetical protein
MIAPLAGGCGDDDDDEAVEEAAESAGARALAETFRVSLLARDLSEDERADDVEVLSDVAAGLPGDPDVSGIGDGDGDGRDDDAKVEVRVDGEAACVSIEANGEVNVTGSGC